MILKLNFYKRFIHHVTRNIQGYHHIKFYYFNKLDEFYINQLTFYSLKKKL